MSTALLSVFNKDGIVEFAEGLLGLNQGWDLLASGGTAKVIVGAGLPVTDVATTVGEPILGHRVVTLSREIHAGLISGPEHEAELARLGIKRIDLLCVDLYPLEQAIADPNASEASVLEKTDIGGPAMLRSAAKGRRIIVLEADGRENILGWLRDGRPNEAKMLRQMAAIAEAYVASYCLASARFLSNGEFNGFIGRRELTCAYGENRWQEPAGLYATNAGGPLALHRFGCVAGSAPSYNNLCDGDRMLQTLTHIAQAVLRDCGMRPFVAIAAKHGNPCGAAYDHSSSRCALQKAIRGDTRAIFGGLMMTNFEIDGPAAEDIATFASDGQKRLLDGVFAPSFTPDAIEILARKRGKCRLLANPALAIHSTLLDDAWRFRHVRGGFLVQPNYTYCFGFQHFAVDIYGSITPDQRNNLLLAWGVGSTSNSNTVTLAKDGMLIGNGIGQQDRVGAAKLALMRARDAGHDPAGAVAYSDSFFPFPDGAQVLLDAGISAVLALRGSVHDREIIALFKERGVPFVTVPDDLGRGFFGH